MKFVGCCVERRGVGAKISNRIMENKKYQSANEIPANMDASGLSAAVWIVLLNVLVVPSPFLVGRHTQTHTYPQLHLNK